MHKEKLHELYTVALEVFSKYGYKKATVEDIASEMGLTKGAIYQYVKNKRDLYDKAVGSRMLDWQHKVMKAISKETTIEQQFVAMCKSAFFYLDKDKVLKKILVNDPDIYPISCQNDPYKELNQKSMGFLKDILERGIEENKFKQMDTTLMTNLLYSIYKMLVITTYLLGEQDANKVIDAAIDALTKGFYKQDDNK